MLRKGSHGAITVYNEGPDFAWERWWLVDGLASSLVIILTENNS